MFCYRLTVILPGQFSSVLTAPTLHSAVIETTDVIFNSTLGNVLTSVLIVIMQHRERSILTRISFGVTNSPLQTLPLIQIDRCLLRPLVPHPSFVSSALTAQMLPSHQAVTSADIFACTLGSVLSSVLTVLMLPLARNT
ncbi:uncharacterized protein LOC134782067 isoform X1 [Penaeus indicus]|uniref:uncharacterized protein LOC134782067 isoform X1 n=1 Tax=Penaeus indicus TaxID=29960 RepID=UPI00300C219B